ncbi:hypothetical protein [Scytonema sp. PRP1]|uniref:hypothetical protein n=1 Tax=Scytonema sp. PRP1 TaxID=3120513 RepID=UPI002FD220F4
MDTDKSVLHPNEKRHSQIHVSCKSCNSEEAQPPNPRYQVQPGNEILEPEALVENGESSPAGGFPAVGDWGTRRVQERRFTENFPFLSQKCIS